MPAGSATSDNRRMGDERFQRIEVNGEPAGLGDLRLLAVQNYGHFTSMQVRDGRVQGLDLHLDRLRRATLELFDRELDLDAVRGWMRRLAGDEGALSLRVNVFSRGFDRDRPSRPAVPDVLVSAAPARAVDPAPLRVRVQCYERDAPHIKHVGTFGLFHQRRLAQQHGFDDALFVTASGAISEGSVWNVGFLDGERIVWPEAPMLRGISMQLLQDGLRRSGVPTEIRRIERAELPGFRSAFFTNSARAMQPIACIDGVEFAADAALRERLEAALALQAWQPL